MSEGSFRLIVIGWLSVIATAIAMAVVRGEGEYAPAAVFGAVGVAMTVWVWRRRSKASAITSLILGLLWTVQFTAYAAAGLLKEEFEADVFAIDAFSMVGGIVLVVGAARAIVEARRHRAVAGAA